jgi:hypothetical protein
MKGTHAYIGVKLQEAQQQLQDGEYIKAYQTILDIEEEWNQRNEEIIDVDVSSHFDSEKIESIKEDVKNPDNVNPSNAEPIEKARLIVGYIDDR